VKTVRPVELGVAIILALLAGCLGCGLAGRLLFSDDAVATPVVVLPTATWTPARSTPTPISTVPQPLPTFTPTPAPSLPMPTPVLPSLTPTPTPTPLVITDPSLTDRELLEQQFQEAQVGRRLVILVHDDHLEREIAAYLATQPEAPYRNVTVRFTPGVVELGGEVEVLGLWVPATIRGQVKVSDCRPEATITELEVGGLLTPRWIRDYVTDLVYDALDLYPDDLLVCLESVQIKEREALVEGTKR